jgi:beta-glucanase (GH16 family)
LTDCEWFKEGDADEFMLVFSDNKQSYAEPFNESLALQGKFGNRGNTNACQSAASSLTAAINQQGIEGVVECSTLPK